MDWKAQWIWDDGDPRPVNAYRIFRAVITPRHRDEASMTAYICADSRYKLYVDSVLVAHGPAPATPGHYAYDEISMKYRLRWDRKNVITIVVNYIGAPTFAQYQHRGGLLFQFGDFVSDDRWAVAKHSPWQADVPRLAKQQGFCEYYDANLEPKGMYGGPVDPAEWERATIVCPAEGGDWEHLEPRGIPMAYERRCEITTLMEWGNCTPANANAVSAQMTDEALRPLTRGTVTRDGDGNVTLTPDGDDMYLLYDMGEEASGFFSMTLHTPGKGTVDIGYDETLRVGETPSGMCHHWREEDGTRYADRYILRQGDQEFRNYGHRAFRYVRLAFRGLTAPVKLRQVMMYESTYPINERGAFACSDERLNAIWRIGRRTLQLCMDDRFMDCPWRERAQWIGDARVEAYGAQYCFGDTLLLARFLRQTAETQFEDGHMDPVGPGEWIHHKPNGPIPGFMCLWIQTIGDYYLLTGDTELPARLLPAIDRVIAWFKPFTDGDGVLSSVPGWNFIDWAPGMQGWDVTARRAPLNLQYLEALRTAAVLARAAGQLTEADGYQAQADTLATALDTIFWNAERELYQDTAPGDDDTAAVFSQHTTCLALLARLGTPERREKLLHGLLHDDTLTQIGSPYFSFYLLAALYEYGEHARSLEYIRTHWGRMLDAGATSWWEEYHGQTSLCHAWSCGPTIDLQAQTLGVAPDAPGWEIVRIAPHPADLRWAKGIVPLPQGDLAVNWRVTDETGGFVLQISAPPGVSLRPVLPALPANSAVTVNGQTVDGAALGVLPGGGYEIVVMSNSVKRL